jgi:hypothetical protein
LTLVGKVFILNFEFQSYGASEGEVAQSVERETENLCVGGSIPSLATPFHPQGKSLCTSTLLVFYRAKTQVMPQGMQNNAASLYILILLMTVAPKGF